MSENADRLLELMLRERFERDDGSAAMAARVRAAWWAGGRVTKPPAPASPHLRHRWATGLVAVAATVIVWLIATGSSGATAADPVLVLTGAGDLERRTHIELGELVWCPTATTIRTRSGRLVAQAGALFTLAESLVLEAGEFTLSADGAARRVHTPWADVEAAPDAELELTITPIAPVPANSATDPMQLTKTLASFRARLPASALSILVLAGSAELARAQGAETLRRGESAILERRTQDPEATKRALVVAEKMLQTLLAAPAKLDTDSEAGLAQAMQVSEGMEKLQNLLLLHPALFTELRRPMRAVVDDDSIASSVRARLWPLVAVDPDVEACRVLERHWATDKDAYDLQVRLAMAESGSKVVRQALAADLADQNPSIAVLTATALALGGSDAGRELLVDAERTDLHEALDDYRRFDLRCQGAVGLAALGEPSALLRLREDLAVFVDERLASGDTVRAAWMVRRALVHLAAPTKVSYLQERMGVTAPELAAPDVTPDDVRLWLRHLTRGK